MLQICHVNLQLEKFSQRNIELIPAGIELLTDTELTQYFIKTWSLNYNDQGRSREVLMGEGNKQPPLC